MDLQTRFTRMLAAGVQLWTEGDQLKVSAPQPLTQNQKAWLATHKADLLALLFRPRWIWIITHPDGRTAEHHFTPDATLERVRGWYPEALAIFPEDEQP